MWVLAFPRPLGCRRFFRPSRPPSSGGCARASLRPRSFSAAWPSFARRSRAAVSCPCPPLLSWRVGGSRRLQALFRLTPGLSILFAADRTLSSSLLDRPHSLSTLLRTFVPHRSSLSPLPPPHPTSIAVDPFAPIRRPPSMLVMQSPRSHSPSAAERAAYSSKTVSPSASALFPACALRRCVCASIGGERPSVPA
jgi:hypothetical protein